MFLSLAYIAHRLSQASMLRLAHGTAVLLQVYLDAAGVVFLPEFFYIRDVQN